MLIVETSNMNSLERLHTRGISISAVRHGTHWDIATPLFASPKGTFEQGFDHRRDAAAVGCMA